MTPLQKRKENNLNNVYCILWKSVWSREHIWYMATLVRVFGLSILTNHGPLKINEAGSISASHISINLISLPTPAATRNRAPRGCIKVDRFKTACAHHARGRLPSRARYLFSEDGIMSLACVLSIWIVGHVLRKRRMGLWWLVRR